MVWYGTSHSTHFRSFWRLGVTGISQVRFIAAVSAEARPTAQPHSVSGGEKWEWPTITVAVCVSLKGLLSVDAWLRCGFLWNTTCVLANSQAEQRLSTAHLARWESTRGLQPGGHVHKRRLICYPYNRHPLQVQAPFNMSVMACHIFEGTQPCLSVPVREFNLCLLVQSC